jgi:hypothetical protein
MLLVPAGIKKHEQRRAAVRPYYLFLVIKCAPEIFRSASTFGN